MTRTIREVALHGGALVLAAFLISFGVQFLGLPDDTRALLCFMLGFPVGLALLWCWIVRNP